MNESNRIFELSTVVFGILVMATLTISTFAEPLADLTALSDVELYFHEDSGRARGVLEERTGTYTKEEFIAFQKAVNAESERRFGPRDTRSPREVLDALRTIPTEDAVARGKELMALRDALERANAKEKALARSQFLADWEAVSHPSIVDESPVARDQQRRFRMYLGEAASLCNNEADLLVILEEHCLNRDIEGGMLFYLEGLGGHDTPAGPLVAKRVESLFADCHTWGYPELGYSDQADAMPYLYGALAACGPDGLEALLRLGRESTDLGLWILSKSELSETEEILWDIYHKRGHNYRYARLPVLSALIEKQSRRPTEERRLLLRQEIVTFLEIPEGEFSLSSLHHAVQVAASTRDSWFLPHIVALKSALEDTDMHRSTEFLNYPEGLSINLKGLERCIEEAKITLSRAEKEQREAASVN